MKGKHIFSLSWRIAVISFLLNIVWENSHAPLFYGFAGSASHFRACFDAAVWDVLLILGMYLLLSFRFDSFGWIESMGREGYLLTGLLWLLIAVIFEKYALVTGRWAYNEYMPIIPFLYVGWSPVLQMIIIPIFSFWFVGRFWKTPIIK